MDQLSLEQADKIASGVVACIKRNRFAPITVNVVDSQGIPIVVKKMDGCSSVAIPEFSYAKAFTCVFELPEQTIKYLQTAFSIALKSNTLMSSPLISSRASTIAAMS